MKPIMDISGAMIRSTIVVIPAYDPGTVLLDLAEEITAAGYRLIVVDDGSGMDSEPIWEHLQRMPRIRVIRHRFNQGKGAAIKTALSYIRNNDLGAEHVVTMDADGQHLVSDMERIARASWKAPDHLILGSRELDREIPVKSYLGNTITRRVCRIVSGNEVHDTQTGLRAFGIGQIDRMVHIPGDRYEYEMNVLLEAGRDGVAIDEIPVTTVYMDKQNSGSHFDPVKDAARIYGSIFRFAGASFRGAKPLSGKGAN